MPGKLTDLLNVSSNQLALQCATLIEDAIFISLEALGEREEIRIADAPNKLTAKFHRQSDDQWTEYYFGEHPLFQFRVIFEKDDEGTAVRAVGEIQFLDADDEKGREREALDPPDSVGLN